MNASQMPPPTYGYVIYRDTPSTEPFDPTAPLQFFPPKDSDDLFFALKMAYPLVSTHAERMRNAVIDFLMGERDAEQAKSQSPSFLHQDSSVSMDSSTDSTRQSGSSSSLLSSPDMMTMPTPSSTTSPAPWAAPMSRTVSNAQSSSSSRAPVTSPLAIDEMTSVFSLSSQAQPRTRVRRKMTDAEKVEYRKRRLVKACEKCSKRKRKCQHNQPMMEKTASPRKAAQLSPQSLSTKALGKQAVRSSRTVPTSSQHFDVASTNSLSYQTTEEEQDQSMEDLIDFSMTSEFDTSLFPWSDTLDWTLLDNDNDQAHRNESLQVSPRSITHSHFQTHGSQASGDSLRLQDNASHEYRDRWHGSELEPESHQLFAVGASMSGPTHTLHNHLQHKPDVSGVSSLSTFTPTLQSPVPHLNDQHMDDQQGDRRFEHLLGMLDSQNVTSSASSSRQQQPLKRRIPKALHSVVVGEQAEHEQFDWHMDADGNGDEGQVPLGQQPLKRRSSNGLRKLKASMHGQSARGSHLSALVIQDDGDKMHSTSTLGHNAGSHFSGIGSGFKGLPHGEIDISPRSTLDQGLPHAARPASSSTRASLTPDAGLVPRQQVHPGTLPLQSPSRPVARLQSSAASLPVAAPLQQHVPLFTGTVSQLAEPRASISAGLSGSRGRNPRAFSTNETLAAAMTQARPQIDGVPAPVQTRTRGEAKTARPTTIQASTTSQVPSIGLSSSQAQQPRDEELLAGFEMARFQATNARDYLSDAPSKSGLAVTPQEVTRLVSCLLQTIAQAQTVAVSAVVGVASNQCALEDESVSSNRPLHNAAIEIAV